MQEFVIHIMNEFGYLGIAALIAIENIFPPIPSEVILVFGGFMTLTTSMTIAGTIIASTIGSTVGAIILYLLGRLLTKEKLYKIINGQIGKILRLKKEDIDKSEEWFLKKGESTVLFCRFIPIVRSLISIPAGMTKMKFNTFIIYTIIGSSIWNTVLTFFGVFAGNAWENVVTYIGKFSKIVLLILIIATIIGIILFYKKRKEYRYGNKIKDV